MLYETFVLVGVDTVDRTTKHLVPEVLAIIGGEEAVPVACDIEAEVPREVLATHHVGREVKLQPFVGDSRSVRPRGLGDEEVPRRRYLHQEVIGVLVVVVYLDL